MPLCTDCICLLVYMMLCIHIFYFNPIITGKSSVACALSQMLQSKGKLSYILDGDNVRHGLNRDLSFKAEDRAENIRRIGESI